jgi:hypothetical protein
MKRLRKIAHLAMVWTSVCLVLVDPAAACRLRNRRCCCCECPPVACDAPVSADAGPLQSAPLTADAPSILPAHPITNEPAASPHMPPPNFSDQAASTPVTISPARPNETPIVEPTIAPASAVRQPAGVSPPAATEVPPPAVVIDNKPSDSLNLTPPSPGPATLRPRQTRESAVTSAPAVSGPSGTLPGNTDTTTNAARNAVKRLDASPTIPAIDSHFVNPPKQPAQPGNSAATAPIAPPAFPPVADDPFVPLAPAVSAPRAAETHDDDPFAPLAPVAPPETKPAAPIAAEPTMKLVDPLSPGSDGQLPSRQWSDNSGQFRVQARLLLILDGKVRLLKETGRTTTVPTERLSDADRAYVEEVISRYGKDLAKLSELAAG